MLRYAIEILNGNKDVIFFGVFEFGKRDVNPLNIKYVLTNIFLIHAQVPNREDASVEPSITFGSYEGAKPAGQLLNSSVANCKSSAVPT